MRYRRKSAGFCFSPVACPHSSSAPFGGTFSPGEGIGCGTFITMAENLGGSRPSQNGFQLLGAVVEDFGSHIPIHGGSLFLRNEEQDLGAIVNFEIHSRAEEQAVDLLERKMQFHSLSVLCAGIGKAVSV